MCYCLKPQKFPFYIRVSFYEIHLYRQTGPSLVENKEIGQPLLNPVDMSPIWFVQWLKFEGFYAASAIGIVKVCSALKIRKKAGQ